MDKRFTPLIIAAAQAAQRRFAVPSSVTMAQWAVESAYGTHLPPGSNNCFGIKAVAGQACVTAMTWEHIGGRDVRVEQRFARYPSLADGFAAHARLLATSRYYAAAMKTWLSGDLADGVTEMAHAYATDPRYAATIMGVIAANDLARFDREAALGAGVGA